MPMRIIENDNLVIEFGFGDILTGIVSRNESEFKNNALAVKFSPKKYKVSETVKMKLDPKEDDLVILDFENIESLDIIIGQLKRIRKDMVSQNESN